jgi:hypothetical protein
MLLWALFAAGCNRYGLGGEAATLTPLVIPPGASMIEIRQTGRADPLEFDVAVRDDHGEQHHQVSMSRSDWARLTGEAYRPEECVRAAFQFLLEREPRESILSRFDVSVISSYFPEFEKALPAYLAGGSGEVGGS